MNIRPNRPPRILSVGDLVLDLVTEVKLPIEANKHQEVPTVRPEPGGGCNFLIAGARMGAEMFALGSVGWDGFGQLILDGLRGNNIDTSGVFVAPGSVTAVVYDLIDPRTHEHSFIGAYATGDPMPFTEMGEELVQKADALFLQGYTLLEKQLPALVDATLARARALRKPIYFDVGPPAASVPLNRLQTVLRFVDTLMLTAEELSIVVPNTPETLAYQILFGYGIRRIVIKRGGSGSTILSSYTRHDTPAFRVPVLDTVGAGDCFDAAFMYGELSGLPTDRAAILANAMGGACVQKVAAGRNAPTRDEVKAVLALGNHKWDF